MGNKVEREERKGQVEIDVKGTLRKIRVEDVVVAVGGLFVFLSLLLPGLGVGLRVSVGIMFLAFVGALVGRITGFLGWQLGALLYLLTGAVTTLLGITALGWFGRFGAVFSLLGGCVVAGVGVVRLLGIKHPVVERLDEQIVKEEDGKEEEEKESGETEDKEKAR